MDPDVDAWGPLGQMMLMGPRVNMMKKIKLTEDLNTGPYRIMRRILSSYLYL
jgi:hypothetical protein